MSIFDMITDPIRRRLEHEVDELIKSEADSLPEKPQQLAQPSKVVEQRAMIDDPFFDNVAQQYVKRHKMSRVSNRMLKEVSMRDWLVSAIIQVRCDTLLRFSRPEYRRFEPGFQFVKQDRNSDMTETDIENIRKLEDFISNCGRTDHLPSGKQMGFGTFLKLIVRDALTIGYVAIEKVLTNSGAVHRFRPVPAETTYHVGKMSSKEMLEQLDAQAQKIQEDRIKASSNERAGYTPAAPREHATVKYVQVGYDERVLAVFGDEDMIFRQYNPMNHADLNGYSYGPLELAILQVTNHLNVENYNNAFFTHGFAARGLLHLKGTVTQSSLAQFRRHFYNSISGSSHAWRTPIIAGLDDVNWVPLSANAREMEYINFNNHVMRTICTQFQIDPVELGLDFLTSPNGRSANQVASNEYKINYSRERGLYPLLMFIEDIINNDILPALDPGLAQQYKFTFVGYTDETPQTNIALLQAEMTVHRSMNDLLREAKKEPIDHPIGDLPMNAQFWGIVDKLMTKGEQRALFLGDKAALGKPELAYLPGDPVYLAWTQFLMTKDRMAKQDKQQQQAMKQQQQQQDAENQRADADHQRQQEQHDLMMREAQSRHANAAVSGGKSLKDVAKEVGFGNKAIEGPDGPMANPVNQLGGDT